MQTNAAQVYGAGVNVSKVDGLSKDFIMGMDVSSYVSVTNSGVVFKDFDGNTLNDQQFFNLLKNCGVNYIRVRVWNDPYDENGNGYGGGNCDIAVAAKIGKLATAAGMKMLINFHYSDFWADPGRQLAPKAWENFSVDEKVTAIYDYTKESLEYLENQGVDIGMVQVGNETTSGFCGVSDWSKNEASICKMLNAGCEAVRDFDSSIKIAIHFTNPEKKAFNWYASMLKNNNVDYDVFASSFYPEWHGTLSNLSSQLSIVANSYGKKVMVAETSYPYTSEDFDGHGNELSAAVSGFPAVSVQGQADYMASIIETISDIGDSAIGVFYWEGAWNAVGSAYSNGSWNQSLYNANKVKWEKYGSGWASSYATEYDAQNVGTWYGGTAVDNQSFFDNSGKALASLNIFKYVYTGATTSGSSTGTTSSTATSGATSGTTTNSATSGTTTSAIVNTTTSDTTSSTITNTTTGGMIVDGTTISSDVTGNSSSSDGVTSEGESTLADETTNNDETVKEDETTSADTEQEKGSDNTGSIKDSESTTTSSVECDKKAAFPIITLLIVTVAVLAAAGMGAVIIIRVNKKYKR